MDDATRNPANEAVVERLIACINDRQIDVMDELFSEDSVMDWPQSGERVVGGDARRAVYRAFPQLPTITPRRLLSSGDLVIAEASLDYGGPVYNVQLAATSMTVLPVLLVFVIAQRQFVQGLAHTGLKG